MFDKYCSSVNLTIIIITIIIIIVFAVVFNIIAVLEKTFLFCVKSYENVQRIRLLVTYAK